MARAVALFSRILFALVVAGLPFMNPALAGGPGAVRVLDIGDLSTSFNEASTNWGQSNPSSIYSAGFRRYGIDKLADALDNDPVEIYRYVKNTIRTVPKYGVHKGAIGAMIDGEGTVFDQVHLMAQLLTAAGYSPTYKVGRITLTGQEFEDWLGIDDAEDACELLTDGGYPVWINGNRCSQVSSGAITTVEMSHAWITVGAQIYDPGYKKQTRYAGIDLGTAMGFNGTTLWSDASPTTGTISGWPADVHYVKDVDRAAVESRLTTYATTLADELEANHHAKSIREVVGGVEVEHQSVPDTGPGTPPYTLTEKASYTSGFPDKFLTTIRIQCDPGHNDIDATLYLHELYARRVFLRRVTGTEKLVVGEDVIDQTPGCDNDNDPVMIKIDYPYPASNGNAGDGEEEFNNPFGVGDEALIVLGADGATGGLIDRFQTDAYEDMEPVTGSLGTEAPTDLIDIEALIGANWLVQLAMLRDLHSGVVGAEHIHHATIGMIAGGTSIYTDIRSHISVELPGDPAADTEAAIQNLTSAMSAVEGAVLTQMLDSDASGTDPKPASVTGMFMAENDAGSRFFEVDDNFSSVDNYLSGYSQEALDALNDLSGPNTKLLLPENGNLTAAGWTGYAVLTRSSNGKAVGHHLGDDIYGDTWPLKGAAGENQNTANSEDNLMVPVDTAFAPAGAGVDPLTGRLAYSMTDITVGTGSFPYALPFTRTYNPSVRSGPQWTHNYQITGRFSGDAYLAMGSRSPAEAARTIVALYAGLELLKVSRAKERLLTTLVIHDWLRRGLCHNVFVINSSASATALFKRPDGTYAMPDQGTSSLAIAGTGGNTTVTYTARGGMEMVFKPIDATEPDPQAFRITDWDWPQGVDLNFTYETNGDMTVANNLGWSMEIKGGAEFDEVEAGFSGSKRYVFYTRPTSGSDEGKITEVKISTFSSGASSDIIAEYGYGDGSKLDIYPTESNPTFGPNTYPLIRYEFDSVGRVKSVERVPEVGIGEGQDYTVVQASMGLITRFYPGGVVGRVEAPSGASSMVRVGRFGRWSESVDGLGRVGRSERDGRGRVTRAQAPEGNATEFTYDIYDNVLTQTLKAKPGSGLSDISSTFEYDNGPTTPFARRHVLTKATDALNNDTTYEYFDDGQLKKVTAPAAPVNGGTSQSAVTQYEYNSRGLVTKITDPDGIETAITVNGKGQVTKTIADALGLAITTRFYYDNYGNLDEIKDHRNKITTNSYNVARGWLTNVDRPLGSETSFSYNVLGQVTSERHKIDTTWFDIDRVYDDAFRLIEIADEAGDTTKFRYHVGDFSTSDEPYREVEDASGRVMRSYFDEAGQVTETVA
ncbi:MAG: hypothetical protein MI755_18940, partial [Sphingomonadales bacterium]|nr:hypothetical protein [Sphingomonadales bacterium]